MATLICRDHFFPGLEKDCISLRIHKTWPLWSSVSMSTLVHGNQSRSEPAIEALMHLQWPPPTDYIQLAVFCLF